MNTSHSNGKRVIYLDKLLGGSQEFSGVCTFRSLTKRHALIIYEEGGESECNDSRYLVDTKTRFRVLSPTEVQSRISKLEQTHPQRASWLEENFDEAIQQQAWTNYQQQPISS